MKRLVTLLCAVCFMFVLIPIMEVRAEGSYQIYVQEVSGEKFTLAVEATTTIGTVKSMIQGEKGYLVENQTLTFFGETLENGEMLSNCNIQLGATLNLVVTPAATEEEVVLEIPEERYNFFDVTLEVVGEGSISPTGNDDDVFSVYQYTNRTFNFTPDTGYTVVDVILDGKSIGVMNEYTFTEIKKDHLLQVTFEKAKDTTVEATPKSNPSTGAKV